MPGKVKFSSDAEPRLQPGGRRPVAARAPSNIRSRQRAGLEDKVAAAGERAVRAEEEVVADVGRREAADRGAAAERLPAHADGVDLVDEDDALAAPLAGEALRLPRQVADDDRVDADERLGEAGAGDRHERRVESGRDRLRQHRLAGARRAEEEQAALALAARALERLARLPEVTTRRTSSFASTWPRTSASLTPHCASPGSKPRIWEIPISSIGPIRIPKLAMKRKKTKTTWIQSAGCDRIVPSPSKIVPAAPHHVASSVPLSSQTT